MPTAESLQRAHRETAAVYLAAGVAAFLVACHFSWNADVVLTVGAGTATGAVTFRVFGTRRMMGKAPTKRTVLHALVGAAGAAVAVLLVTLLLKGDGWGVLAMVLLMFGVQHAWLASSVRAATAPAA
jgi:hypothetical protein